MDRKVATAVVFLALVGCQLLSSVHGEEEQERVAGLCLDSPCDADPNRTCFCCGRLANEPCYDTLRQCLDACPVCNFIVCPPPRRPPVLDHRRARLGMQAPAPAPALS